MLENSEELWFDSKQVQGIFPFPKDQTVSGAHPPSYSIRTQQYIGTVILYIESRGSHNEELNDLYSSSNIVGVIKSRRMRWTGHVARMGEERGVYRVLLGKPEGRRPLGRPRRRWVDNIRMDLQEVGCGYMDWIGLVKVRDRWRTLVSVVMNLRVK